MYNSEMLERLAVPILAGLLTPQLLQRATCNCVEELLSALAVGVLIGLFHPRWNDVRSRAFGVTEELG